MNSFEFTNPDTFDKGESEDSISISMFFDFESPPPSFDVEFPAMNTPSPPREASPPPSKPTTTTTAPRGGIRVSLACIPCRSRHVKCGAEMPACSRCQTDDKPCFYAKSRRGMRDRSAPKNSKSASNKASPSPDFRQPQTHDNLGFGSYNLGNEPWGTQSSSASSSVSGSIDGRFASALEDVQPTSTRRLIDLFYAYFYKAHPFLLPRYYLLARLQTDPVSLSNLVPVISYIGALYDPSISSTHFRDLALAQIDSPSFPVHGFSVQTLLLTAIALHCEDFVDLGRGVLERATWMAIELGMNSFEFAEVETDSVLGESWRRTYWGICATERMFAGSNLGNGSTIGNGVGMGEEGFIEGFA